MGRVVAVAEMPIEAVAQKVVPAVVKVGVRAREQVGKASYGH